ncbi:MAG: hypothetical protein R2848_18340 [Thermomicrobiales bacterium]
MPSCFHGQGLLAIPAGIGLAWIYRKTSGLNDFVKHHRQRPEDAVVVSEVNVGRKPRRQVGRRSSSTSPSTVRPEAPDAQAEFKDYYKVLGVERSADDAAR